MTSFVTQFSIRQLVLCLLFITASAQSEIDGKIVQTSSGAVRSLAISVLNSEVDAFLGIPYALPPVGELRFQKPIPIPPWFNVYNATSKPPPCYQNISYETYYTPKMENLTEDCLYLNIWVPRSQNKNPKLKTMMVFIHGGAFNMGSTDMDLYDGAILAAYGDIIVATINFRIGAFGYLTALTEDARGNMAIADQILALKWIHENAEIFGGDNSQITLFGESSGAMTTSGIMMSPYTQNLFKRGIFQSGGALIPLFFNSPEKQVKMSNSLAVLTGCANNEVNLTTDPEKVLNCLRSLPASDIAIAEGLMKEVTQITFTPIYGDDIMPLETSVALKNQLYKTKEVLMGINKDEGAFFLVTALPQYFGRDGFNGVERIGKSLAYSLLLGIFKALGEKNEREIADYYIKRLKSRDTANLRKAIYDSIGDFLIGCSTILYADLYSSKSENIYFYVFPKISSQKPTEDWMGSTHIAEISFVFGMPLREGSNYTEEEKQFSRRIMDRWTAFAKTGNPNIPRELKWPKYSYDYPVYLELDQEEMIRLRPNEGRCEFWRDRFQANMDFPKLTERLTYSYLKSNSFSETPSRWVEPFYFYLPRFV